ncbi:MAG: replication protein [candidate division Zixibacteria bacterium]
MGILTWQMNWSINSVGILITGQEWRILWVVFRQTYGYIEKDRKGNPIKDSGGFVKKKTDRISHSQFAEKTGIDRRKCNILLKSLVEKGVLLKIKNPNRTVRYGFQKDYDKWAEYQKRPTATQKDGRVPPKRMAKLPPNRAHTKEKKENYTKEISPASPVDSKKEELSWAVKALKKVAEESYDFQDTIQNNYKGNYWKLAGQLAKKGTPSWIVFCCWRLYQRIEDSCKEINNLLGYLHTLIDDPKYELGDGLVFRHYVTAQDYYESFWEGVPNE